MKRIIEQYNTRDTVLVITSYLARNKHNFNAVSEYSKRILSYLARDRKVLVLAEKTGNQKPFSPEENVFVVPSWIKGNPFSFISVLLNIIQLSAIKSVYVQFEFNVFGGIIPNLALLFLLLILRLMGKQVTFELHQVILDVGKLVKHVYITNSFVQKIMNAGLKVYYLMLGMIVNNIVVFETELKDRLTGYIDGRKINVLNLPTAQKKITLKSIARQKLELPKNKFIMMVFGFINGYKGIDWIIDAFKGIKDSQVRLMISGGENPYLKDQPSYQRFYQSIITSAHKNPKIIRTGFVPEDKVSMYFSAADLVVMPYEVFMSASGPFSLALSHNKPVILSDKLFDYCKSWDFAFALRSAGLEARDIFFNLDDAEFKQKIKDIRENKEYLQKLIVFSKTLNEMRLNDKFQMKMDDILFRQQSVKIATYIPEPLLVKS